MENYNSYIFKCKSHLFYDLEIYPVLYIQFLRHLYFAILEGRYLATLDFRDLTGFSETKSLYFGNFVVGTKDFKQNIQVENKGICQAVFVFYFY